MPWPWPENGCQQEVEVVMVVVVVVAEEGDWFGIVCEVHVLCGLWLGLSSV